MSATLDPKLRNGVGASESSCLFGLHPYMTPLDLYARIVGVAQPEANEVQRRGSKLERYVADEYAELEGCWGSTDGFGATMPEEGKWLLDICTQRHPERALLIASPDRIVVRDGVVERLVEIKTARSRQGWEDPDDVPDGVPPHILIQVQHQLLVGVSWNGAHVWPDEAHVVACVGHLDDFRVFTVKRSEAIGKAITERVETFWSAHVEPRVQPPWDGSAAGDVLLKAMYPADLRPLLLPASPAAQATALRMREAQAKADEWQTKADAEKQALRALIGDAAGMEGEGWRVTWKRNKDSHSTDWQAVAEAAGASPALIQAHTTTKPGARVLRQKWSET